MTVLFCDSLTYSGILVLAVMRSWKYIRREHASLKYRREFASFYIMVWVTLSLTILLYLLISAGVAITGLNIVPEVALYFLPNILMVL